MNFAGKNTIKLFIIHVSDLSIIFTSNTQQNIIHKTTKNSAQYMTVMVDRNNRTRC